MDRGGEEWTPSNEKLCHTLLVSRCLQAEVTGRSQWQCGDDCGAIQWPSHKPRPAAQTERDCSEVDQ